MNWNFETDVNQVCKKKSEKCHFHQFFEIKIYKHKNKNKTQIL